MSTNNFEAAAFYQSLEGDIQSFYKFHAIQLINNNFPNNKEIFIQLYEKLQKEIFDAGEYFEMIVNEEEETYQVKAKKDIKAESQVFLIDHAFSFRFREIRGVLMQNQQALERLQNLLQFHDKKKKLPGYEKKAQSFIENEEFESMKVGDPSKLNIAMNCVTLSLIDNNISSFDLMGKCLEKLDMLKALWLNANPISENLDELFKYVETNFPHIQILNSKFTKNADKWAFIYSSLEGDFSKIKNTKVEEIRYLDLSDRDVFKLEQLETIVQNFKGVRVVNLTGHNPQDFFESNQFFVILKSLPKLKEVLVDHDLEEVLYNLYENGKLETISPTLRKVNGFYLDQGRPTERDYEVQKVIDNLWKVAGCYRLSDQSKYDESSVWYIMDEFGSSVEHSDIPNVMVQPFLYVPNYKMDEKAISYSLLWPKTDIKAGDLVYRDYLHGITEKEHRSARLGVWFDIPKDFFINVYEQYQANLKPLTDNSKNFVQEFLSKHKPDEFQTVKKSFPEGHKLKVWTDWDLVASTLTSQHYEVVPNREDADVLWFTQQIDQAYDSFKNQMINQYPFEGCIVFKNQLATTAYKVLGQVKWLPQTFLVENFECFMGCFYTRQEQHKKTFFIVKPPNMARSIDMVVSNNLDAIVRLQETGPKLIQKYISTPLRVNQKKTDIRVTVLVRSVEPLVVYVHKIFWPRLSNSKYTLDPRGLMEYGVHFTVNNYSGDEFKPMNWDQYIIEFNKENSYRNLTWDMMFNKICDAVRELFICVKTRQPNMHNEASRALYGLDIMIEDKTLQPVILEATFSPDHTRACKYYDNYFNEIFDCLFYDQPNENFIRIL